MWRRIEAFRDLLHRGEPLLAEAIAFSSTAEESLERAAADLAGLRERFEEVSRENERLSAELAESGERLAAARREAEADRSRRTEESGSAAAQLRLERIERERLEKELASVRATTRPVEQAMDIEGRLRSAERELEAVRRTLLEERARRNRAISLIKPTAGARETAAHAAERCPTV